MLEMLHLKYTVNILEMLVWLQLHIYLSEYILDVTYVCQCACGSLYLCILEYLQSNNYVSLNDCGDYIHLYITLDSSDAIIIYPGFTPRLQHLYILYIHACEAATKYP
jgi:hypothetical protein